MAQPPPPEHHLSFTEKLGQESLTKIPRASHHSSTKGMVSGVLEFQDVYAQDTIHVLISDYIRQCCVSGQIA